jgi:hypothetical protein
VLQELEAYAEHRQQPLSFEGLNQEFYVQLRNYMLGMAGRSPRTFNTYVKRLRSFLFWAEDQGLPVPPLFRRTLRLEPSYVGKEALTQDELLRVSALDFVSPRVKQYLAQAFPEPPYSPPKGATRFHPLSTCSGPSGPATCFCSAPTRAFGTATPGIWAGSTFSRSKN